jgi:hypothetical protein
MFFALKFELILIIGSNNVLTEGARKVYRGRRVGQGWSNTCSPRIVRTKTLRLMNISGKILTGVSIEIVCGIHPVFIRVVIRFVVRRSRP